jgi:hypothetical protein
VLEKRPLPNNGVTLSHRMSQGVQKSRQRLAFKKQGWTACFSDLPWRHYAHLPNNERMLRHRRKPGGPSCESFLADFSRIAQMAKKSSWPIVG